MEPVIDRQQQRLSLHLKNGELKLSGNPTSDETQAALDAAAIASRIHQQYQRDLFIQMCLLVPLLMLLAGLGSFVVARHLVSSQGVQYVR